MAGPRFLQVGVLNWKTQEVQDTLVLCACANMSSHLVPVVSVELKTLRRGKGKGGGKRGEG